MSMRDIVCKQNSCIIYTLSLYTFDLIIVYFENDFVDFFQLFTFQRSNLFWENYSHENVLGVTHFQ